MGVIMIGIGQYTAEKSILLSGSASPRKPGATATVSKTENDFVDQLQELEDLYLELLALRMRVHRAERVTQNPAYRHPKTRAGHPVQRKQSASKRARLPPRKT
jgi:hypothetical protein